MAATTSSSGSGGTGRTFFGHPRGLATLFLTEMWERFSYYGMRGLLILFLAAGVAEGGMGLDDKTAAAIYGLYTSFVYLLALPGGWIADRLIGQRKAVWYGGIIIASGHFSMAIPTDQTFFLGLVLIVVGTGLLKPNVSAIVGGLYPLGGAQRDAGFSVFYMGINTGALIGPLVCGFLGEKIDWHFGFAAAGVGMVLGLVQFRVTERYLGTKGVRPVQHPDPEIQRLQQRKRWAGLWIGTALLGLLVGSSLLGLLRIDPVAVAGSLGTTILVVASLYFLFMLTLGVKETRERKRVGAIVILFFFSAMFWSGFEQAGSSLNLFADRFTDRMLFGREMPASWLQSINPLFIILFAPVFGWGWVALAQRHLDPSSPGKFALGLGLLGLGFAVMLVASKIVVAGQKVLPTWLILTYLLHTFGELALSPVGLSTVTKLAPKTMVGQMMGVWFISTAFGNLIAGLVAGRFDPEQIQQMPDLFRAIVFFCLGAALVMLLLIKPMKRLMSGIR